MRIIAASSLSSALGTLSFKAQQRLKRKGLVLATIPGLNCHEKTPTRSKSAIFYLKDFKNEEVVIWHDAKNNSLSPHQKNYESPYSGKDLANQLKPFSRRIRSTNYCQKDGTSNIYQDLKTAILPVVSITRDIISRRKEKNHQELKKYRPLHQSTNTELKVFFMVLKHKGVGKRIIGKRHPERPNKRRRKNYELLAQSQNSVN